jgi:hypothetical protein
MAQVKGTLVNAWRNFLKERYGEEKVAAAIQSLDEGDRIQLQSPKLDSTWYPMELQQVMGRLTKAVAAPSDKDIALELGRYMADYTYGKVYRTLLMGNLNRNKDLDWFDDVLFQGLRRCATEKTGPCSSIVRYYYLEGKPTWGVCRSLVGFLTRQIELSGRQGVTCAHQKCAASGADCCEFLLQWRSDD